MTLNQFNDAIRNFCEAHYQVKRFGSGTFSMVENSLGSSAAYPYVWLNIQSVTVRTNTLLLRTRLVVFDIALEDGSNVNDIWSDTQQIALDCYQYLKHLTTSFDVVGNPTITTISEKLSERVAGVEMVLDVELDYDSTCNLPLSLVPELVDVSGPQYITCETLGNCPTYLDLRSDVDNLIDQVDILEIETEELGEGLIAVTLATTDLDERLAELEELFPGEYTSGSLVFIDSLGRFAQDNPHLFWNNTTDRLGIGTVNPYSDLTVINSAFGHISLGKSTASTDTDVGSYSFINTNISASEKRIAEIVSRTNGAINSGLISFWTYNAGTGAERARINAAGHFLLGTSSISSTRIAVVSSGATSATWTSQFHNSTGANNALMVRDDGRIAILNASPQEALHVKGNLRLGLNGDSGYYIDWGQDNVASSGSFARIQGLRTSSAGNQAGDLIFYTKPSIIGGVTPEERWRIFETGQSRFQLAHTATSNGDYGWNYTGNITAKDTVSAALNGFLITPTLTASANNQVLRAVSIVPTYITGAFTGIQQVSLSVQASLTNGTFVTFRSPTNVSLVEFATNASSGLINVNYNTGSIENRINGDGITFFNLNKRGNVGIGTSSPNAMLGIQGNSTSTGNALLVQNSTPDSLYTIENTGRHIFGTQFNYMFPSANGNSLSLNGRGLVFSSNVLSQDAPGYTFIGSNSNSATGSQYGFGVNMSFVPTSGTRVFNLFEVLGTINQTGGANGISRGIFVNPTLTSAADFRAIETTAGKVIFSGTDSYLRNHRMTTSQRNALTGLIGGEQIFNTDTNKHQGYNGTTWNDMY